MKWLALVLRVLVGLPMFVFGVNYFVPFIAMDPGALPESATQLMGVLVPTKWMAVVKVLEVVGGVLLLVGRYVPLGLILLVPVTVNIAIWDAVILKYSMPPLGTIMLVCEIVLLWYYRAHFAPLFVAKRLPPSGSV